MLEREHGRRFRLFANSWSDFDNQVPTAWRTDLWDLIRKTPRLDWQLLTKRPQNIRKMLSPEWGNGCPPVARQGCSSADHGNSRSREYQETIGRLSWRPLSFLAYIIAGAGGKEARKRPRAEMVGEGARLVRFSARPVAHDFFPGGAV
jgi:hypothetical protein